MINTRRDLCLSYSGQKIVHAIELILCGTHDPLCNPVWECYSTGEVSPSIFLSLSKWRKLDNEGKKEKK